eukprot:maker-scaffold1929_size24837-snap-gene-0.6 protein:Tk07464 transcript:maker-scaffold1929_size24837-snap-gene-0.6-mRNA-1 annotation:"transcription factor"
MKVKVEEVWAAMDQAYVTKVCRAFRPRLEAMTYALLLVVVTAQSLASPTIEPMEVEDRIMPNMIGNHGDFTPPKGCVFAGYGLIRTSGSFAYLRDANNPDDCMKHCNNYLKFSGCNVFTYKKDIKECRFYEELDNPYGVPIQRDSNVVFASKLPKYCVKYSITSYADDTTNYSSNTNAQRSKELVKKLLHWIPRSPMKPVIEGLIMS